MKESKVVWHKEKHNEVIDYLEKNLLLQNLNLFIYQENGEDLKYWGVLQDVKYIDSDGKEVRRIDEDYDYDAPLLLKFENLEVKVLGEEIFLNLEKEKSGKEFYTLSGDDGTLIKMIKKKKNVLKEDYFLKNKAIKQ